MTSIELTAYPRFKSRPTGADLEKVYSPTPEEMAFGRALTRGVGKLLGFLVMLKYFQRLGCFPKPDRVPEAVISHVRSRLGLSPESKLVLPERSLYCYQTALRKHLGVRGTGGMARRLDGVLSPRESEVLRLVAEGLSNREIAGRLFVTERTVRSHLSSIFGKLGADNRTQAVALARQQSLL